MKKRFLLIISIISTLFITNISNVYAGTVNFNIKGNDKVTINNTIDLTISVSDINGFTVGLATAQGDISYDSSYLEYINFQDASSSLAISYGTSTKRFVALGMNGEYIKSSEDLITLTFRAKQIGTTTVNLGNIVAGDTKAISHSANAGSKVVEIVGQETSDEMPPTTPNSSDNKNNNNSNSNPNSNSSSSNKNNSSKKSSDNYLATLIINDAKISPSFSKDTTSYSVTVPNDVTKLDLSYVLSNSKASAKVVGNSDLKAETNNVVEIIVTAEDGSVRTYTLNVTRSSDTSNNKLSKLEIKESSLFPKFDSDVNEYTIKLSKGIDKLTIDAIAADKNSKVEIIDNKNLSKNNSVVLVKVTDKNGFSNYYKLKVDNDKKTTIFGINIKYIIWGLSMLILLLLFLIFLILWKRKKKEKKEVEPIRIQVVKQEEDNNDLYDDVVTKDEIIEAIEEKNAKKLKMLLTQEEANKLKEELKKEERETD